MECDGSGHRSLFKGRALKQIAVRSAYPRHSHSWRKHTSSLSPFMSQYGMGHVWSCLCYAGEETESQQFEGPAESEPSVNQKKHTFCAASQGPAGPHPPCPEVPFAPECDRLSVTTGPSPANAHRHFKGLGTLQGLKLEL